MSEYTQKILIVSAEETVKELRACKVSADPAFPVHPAICSKAADTLEAFMKLAEVVQAGRYKFSNLNDHGKTILDFFNVWLDQKEDELHKLRSQQKKIKELVLS